MTPPLTPPNVWDAADAECRPWERVLQENWEQEERDAMFTAEIRGGPSLMDRVTPYLLFTAAALISAGVIVVVGRLNGWCQ